MAASRRAIRARDFGPGISVRIWIVFIFVFLLAAAAERPRFGKLVPTDGCFVEIDKHLFGFEIFFEAPRAEFAAEPGLFVPAPGRLHVGRLHVIDPHDAGAQRLYDAESFVDIARPDGSGEAVRRVIGDANGFGFAIKGDYGGDRAKDFFAGDARAVFHIIKDRRLDVVTLAELPGPRTADGNFRFLPSDLEVRSDTVVLLFANEWTHLGLALERRTKLDALGLFRHGFDKFGIDFFLDENAAARGANFALIDEHAEECTIDGGFPIGIGKEDVGRLPTELESDALECVGGALHDHFPDGGTPREGDLVHVGMSNERGACSFAKTVDNVDHARRQSNFFEPIGNFQRRERSLFGGLERAGD